MLNQALPNTNRHGVGENMLIKDKTIVIRELVYQSLPSRPTQSLEDFPANLASDVSYISDKLRMGRNWYTLAKKFGYGIFVLIPSGSKAELAQTS